MSVRRGVMTGGSFCVDFNKSIPHWPEEESATPILDVQQGGGGPVWNLGCDLKRLDPSIPVEAVAVLGQDSLGDYLVGELDRYGIGRTHVIQQRGGTTPFTDALCVTSTGKRTHLFIEGVSADLCPDHFDFQTTTAKILHLGLPGIHKRMDAPWNGSANGWQAVLKRAKAAGLQTNFELITIDPARLAEIILPCLPHLDLLVLNDFEIGALAGMTTTRLGGETDIKAVRQAAQIVMQKGAMDILVIHFPRAAFAITKAGQEWMVPSVNIPQAEVKGANGAGDAFAAGFIYGFHESWPIEDAVRLAHASAATSLRDVSTVLGVEPWQDCLKRASEWGWRKMPDS
jgi:sugar/nucleoside kinase (ribokinase family)